MAVRPGGRTSWRISQRQYWGYVLSLMPTAGLLNLMSTVLAATLVMPTEQLVPEFLVPTIIAGQLVGYGMLFGVLLLRWFRQFVLGTRHNEFVWQLVIGTPCGFVVARQLTLWVTGHDILQMSSRISVQGSIFAIGSICVFGNLYYTVRWRLAKERWRAERAARAAAEAHLRALQAQMEPHFLFNTLANLNALICQSPEAARNLLAQLNRYLETSLSHARGDTSSLGTEMSLLEAYLNIMAIRLPDRLRTHVECAADCADLAFPPMLLHPLVENAVIHGIEPAADGGEIELYARRDEGVLVVVVSDTGIGLGDAPTNPFSNGTGLTTLRDRLAALYGDDASLYVVKLFPRGTRAIVRIRLDALAA